MSEEAYVRSVPQKAQAFEVKPVRQITGASWLVNTPDGDQIAVSAKYDPNKNLWWCYLSGRESIATWNTK